MTKLTKPDELWNCSHCMFGYNQPAQPYGARICRICGTDNEPELVYVMRMMDTPYYKIGVSKNVQIRHAQLQTSSPLDIEIMAIYHAHEDFDTPYLELEDVLHTMFQRFHVRREWYAPNEETVAILLDKERLFKAVWYYVFWQEYRTMA